MEPATIFIAPPVEDLTEDQVHYLSVLGLARRIVHLQLSVSLRTVLRRH